MRAASSRFARLVPSSLFTTSPTRYVATRWSSTLFRTSMPQFAPITFKLADIGEGIAEVELLRWYVKEGDTIEEMDNICEVQSDKSAVEISSPHSGSIIKFYNQIGDMVKIGAPLMDIEVEGEGSETAAAAATPTTNQTTPPPPPPTTTTTSGVVTKAPAAQTTTTAAASSSKKPTKSNEVKASPACRAHASRANVDLCEVVGTGPDGRVLKEDVIAFIESSRQQGGAAKTAAPAPKATTTTGSPPLMVNKGHHHTAAGGDMKEEVLLTSGVAKGMVKSMKASLDIPHMSLQEDVDMSSLIQMRAELNQFLNALEPPQKLTVTPLIVKAISVALKHVPIMNSKFNVDSADRYTIYHNHNISIAIDTPHGLLVPNIKNVETLSLTEVQYELGNLQKMAMAGKLGPAQLTGGTIALSNVGVIGGTAVRPILFDGQATILGLGRLQKLPRFNSATKGFDAKDIMNITASVDHRHVDGATVARFIAKLRQILENPALMML